MLGSVTFPDCMPFTGLETNAGPLARDELNYVRASGSSDLRLRGGRVDFFF